MALAIGDTFGRYLLLDVLGEGGMGIVYRARDTRLNRDVALKFLPDEAASDPSLRERLFREARAAAGLQHPTICPIYEVDDVDGHAFIAMEIADGQTLEALLHQRTIGVQEAIRLAMDIGRGLAAAHAKQILHRDIKPANIMVSDGGQVKILDFGVAQLPDTSRLTTGGAFVGTAAYMAPEQLAGENSDHRSDIWSLGVVLYQLLTGVRPFRERTDPALMYAIVSKVPEPVAALRSHVPLRLEWVLNKALAKRPQDRYETVETMCADLGALLEHPADAAWQPPSRAVTAEWQDDRPLTATLDPRLPMRLLVVDDEPDLELLMRQHFRKRIRSGEFEFAFAANGQEALDKLETDHTLDMVLTDIRMPVMDGLTLLGRLASLDRTVKAVVVSAYGDLGNIRTAMNQGAFDFVTKPIDFTDLETTIAKTWKELHHYREARELRRRFSALEQEMDVARRVQSAVVPRSLPSPAWLARSAYANQARDVGGDFHDVFEIAPDRVGIVIGEVFGSGVASAVFAAISRTLLKALGERDDSPARVLDAVSTLLHAEGLNAMSVTVLFGVLDASSHTFEYCTAGHPHPYVLCADGTVHQLEGKASPPLGTGARTPYTEVQVPLAAGDRVFLYSDGIPEGNDVHRAMFSHERLRMALQAAGTGSPAEIVRAVVRAVDDFSADAPQSDDQTALAFALIAQSAP